MFSECSSLTNIKKLQKWNVQNGQGFEDMFADCSLLKDSEINELFEKWKI